MSLQPPSNFHEIPYPVRVFGGLNVCRYLVYVSPNDIKEVQAETAAEAMQKSGVTEAIRIVRYMPGREVLLNMAALTRTDDAGASAEALPAPAAAPESPAANANPA